MRQRVKLAQALVHDPLILVLDEPLTGIDPPGRRDLLALFAELRREGKTILFSSHILHEVEGLADEIVLIAGGRLLASGSLGRVRGLIDEHPLTVRITCGGRRRLAAALLAQEAVVGVSLDGGAAPAVAAPLAAGSADGDRAADRGDLIVKVARPEQFYADLPAVLLALRADVERLETLDASAEAVFDYLVDRRAFGGRGAG
jgi:ABC-2 type transport system ATP-binding protein